MGFRGCQLNCKVVSFRVVWDSKFENHSTGSQRRGQRVMIILCRSGII